ncbi:MAG TPA: biotin--[acetyl-CoA-carboxylase] ligase [Anaerolineales bacterium]|nr:biotin--[acetyl-CoA-carboxylase] ligase [Anaerolineales bacterium]
MDQAELLAALAGLPLGGFRFYKSVGSTNDEALRWAAQGASDISIVLADEQTAGRGRSGRKWHTPPGSALALSILVRPTAAEHDEPARLTGLGALAVVQCCREFGLEASIKWPNDVLLGGKKVAGILVESDWSGNTLNASVIGIGVNVKASAVPAGVALGFPATSLEGELGRGVSRPDSLRRLVAALVEWRRRLGTPEFVQAWEDALAFHGKPVILARDGEPPLHGRLLGLEPDGSLRLETGETVTKVHFGEIHLRPGQ